MKPEGSFTLSELVTEAQARGYEVTERRLHDWVAKGLIDRPQRRGLGRGRGTVAFWPPEQLHLLVELLRRRDQGLVLATLCNIPVWTWVFWGERYVPLRQVRRALRTYARRYGRGSMRSARIGATQAIASFLGDVSGAKVNRLRDTIALAGVRGRLDEGLRAEILERFGALIADRPDLEGIEDTFVRIVQARMTAIENLDGFSDQEFEQARLVNLQSVSQYRQQQPQLAASASAPGMFDELTEAHILNNACLNILTILGMEAMVSGKNQ